MQIPTQNGKMKILSSEFHPRTNLTALLFSILVSRNKKKILRILKFRFLRVPSCEFFRDFVKERFSWPENGFIVLRRYDLVAKSVVQFILG
jgi:hypothetical protein